MTVLVAYASRHGATAGIAQRIAAALLEAGVPAEARPVQEVRDATAYDAFVVGSAAYMFHWLKEATRFVDRHRAVLATRPLWLFSSGPVGTELVDKDGKDVFVACRPREWEQLVPSLHPRGDRVFFGAWDPDAPPVGIAERIFRRLPVSRDLMPVGDFRDWPAIDSWAGEIATQLRSGEVASH
jgi:menaquinone-dependent protoporphyrinogen oxidase